MGKIKNAWRTVSITTCNVYCMRYCQFWKGTGLNVINTRQMCPFPPPEPQQGQMLLHCNMEAWTACRMMTWCWIWAQVSTSSCDILLWHCERLSAAACTNLSHAPNTPKIIHLSSACICGKQKKAALLFKISPYTLQSIDIKYSRGGSLSMLTFPVCTKGLLQSA